MIRINLVRPQGLGGKPAKALISPREAITGAVLLAAAFGMLFYLASRQKPAAAPEPPAKVAKAKPVVKAPPEPRVEMPTPPPPAKVEAPPAARVEAPPPAARAEVPPASPPAAGCRVEEVTIRKSGGSLTVVLRTNTEVKYRSFELFKPDRIAVDLASCTGAFPKTQASQAVEDPVVQRVRANQFRDDVFRVVVDVSEMPRYEIRGIDKGLEIRVLGKKP